jgi:hypothetical protein
MCGSALTATPPPAVDACTQASNACIANTGNKGACEATRVICLKAERTTHSADAPSGDAPPDAATFLRDAPPLSLTPDETEASRDDETAKSCLARAQDDVADLHGHIERVLVTRSPKSGVVWRADFSFKFQGKTFVHRFVCTNSMTETAPLEMSDPAQNTPPLTSGPWGKVTEYR